MRDARNETDRGTREMSDGFKSVDSSVLSVTGRLTAMAAAAASVYGVLRNVISSGDQFRRLEGQFSAITKSAERGAAIFGNVLETSKNAGIAIEDTAQAMTRFTLAAEDLKRTDDQVQRFTENLFKLGRIGGSSQASLSAGAVQLAQGLGAGALLGDELNSVLENIPLVAKAIADELGVGIGQLKEMGANGEILADVVFDAILNKTEEIEAAMEQLPPTVEQVTTQLSIAWAQFTAEIDESVGASQRLVSVLQGAVALIDQVRNIPAQAARNEFQMSQFRARSNQGVPSNFQGPILTPEMQEVIDNAPVRLTVDPNERTSGFRENFTPGPDPAHVRALRDLATPDHEAPTHSDRPTERPIDYIHGVDESLNPPPRTRRRGGGGRRRSRTSRTSTRAADGLIDRMEERLARLNQEQQLIGLNEREQTKLTAAFERERIERELLNIAQRENQEITPEQIALAQNYAAAAEEMTLAIFDQTQALKDQEDAAEKAEQRQKDLAKSISDTSSKFLGAVRSADSFSDALKNIALVLLEITLQGAVGQGPAGGLFNDLLGVGANGLLGLLGGSGVSAGPSLPSTFGTLPITTAGFSRGGVPPIGRFVTVGENGPEPMFVGETARIMSNEDMRQAVSGGASASPVIQHITNHIHGLNESQALRLMELKEREASRRAPGNLGDRIDRGFGA
ncbi:MAG: tape measure protein [Pseudomonadota bacterium]